MKTRLFPLLLWLSSLLLLLSACGGASAATSNTTPSSAPVSLNIFAAASLTRAFTVIEANYTKLHPSVTFKADYDSSSTLEQQIANGAAADVFASADTTNMQKAITAGLVTSAQIFARNRLVVILPASNPGHIATLKDLARSGVKIDVAAATVPVGKYTLQVLANMTRSPDYGPAYVVAVTKNVVSKEENDAAIVQKVQLGEVDAGVVYVSDINPATAAQFTSITIPDDLNVIASYPLAALKNSAHGSEAQAFVQYVLSPAGQAVLKQYNFIPANP
ncbi:MAG TPA: molybdate ABC transporter substrate-binding protein [Ktedonobacteraceae bacterium]